MTDDNVVSFKEFIKRRRGNEYKESAITQVLQQDLREQEDLIDWYIFHTNINKYKFFLHTLFYNNRRRVGENRTSGYIIAFNEKHIEIAISSTIEALKWLGRNYTIIEAKGRSIKDIGKIMIGKPFHTQSDFFTEMKHQLLKTNNTLVITELSKSTIGLSKAVIARKLIKILDDAHLKNINPRADLIFVDYASFLQKAWDDIGRYLNILPSAI